MCLLCARVLVCYACIRIWIMAHTQTPVVVSGVQCGGAQVSGQEEHKDVEELEKPCGQLWQREKARTYHNHVSHTCNYCV